MTNEEILKRAIEKAIKNGLVYTQRSFDYMMDLSGGKLVDYVIEEKLYYPIIFSHSFAKSFWGTKIHVINYGDNKGILATYSKLIEWEYHLQQMVREEEPLKYLEKFL